MTGKQMLRLLKKNGFQLDRVQGSHHILKKDEVTIVLPVHGKTELKKGLQEAILKQAGLN